MKYGIYMPQGGGFLIAAKNYFKYDPEFIFSFEEYKDINSEIINYYNLHDKYTLNPTYNDFSKFRKKVDIVFIITPCNDLSSNSKNFSTNHTISEKACTIDLFYKVINDIAQYIKPKFIVGENAEYLSKNMGRYVRSKLNKILQENNYSSTYITINAEDYGIPQKRTRTYYIFHKDENSIILPFIKNKVNYAKWLYEKEKTYLPNDYYHNKERASKLLQEDWLYKFILYYYGKDYRNKLQSVKKKTFQNTIFYDRVIYKEFYEFLVENNNLKLAEWVKSKFPFIEKRKRIYDNSFQFYTDRSRVIISRFIDKIVHPTEERLLTYREMMTLQGFPVDMYFSFDPYNNSKLFGKVIGKSIPSEVGYKIIDMLVKKEYEISVGKTSLIIDNVNKEIIYE